MVAACLEQANGGFYEGDGRAAGAPRSTITSAGSNQRLITLPMLKAPELFLAQSFPADYVIHEIPDPALLFEGGVQAADPLAVPCIPLTAAAQVRMCGNSVAPAQAEALARANFAHEAQIYGSAAA